MPLTFKQPIHYRPPFPESRLTEPLTLPWFAAINNDTPAIAASPTLERVSLDQAIKSVASNRWSDFKLEKRNDLTAELSLRLRHRDSEWNKCAIAFADYFNRHLAPVIVAALAQHNLPPSMLTSVRWDIISNWQEINYHDIVKRPGFYCRLFEIYRHGHIPCGCEILPDRSESILYR